MKKLLLTLFTLLLCLSFASADVIQPIRFVDAGGNLIAGTTTVLYYDVTSTGSMTLTGTDTATGTGGSITYPTNLPAGVSYYLTYFLKDAYLPWVMDSDFSGTGSVLAYNVRFLKAENCHAPIREVSAVNVERAGYPLIVNVNASLDGSVYSAFVGNGFPILTDPAYADYFSATTQVTIRIIDLSTNTEVHTDSKTMNLMADSSANFQFSWIPTKNGYYKIVAESQVIDNQCNSATSYKEYDNIDSIRVFTTDEVTNSCYSSFPDGINLVPIDPVSGHMASIVGTKISNYFSTYGATPVPVTTQMELVVKDSSSAIVFAKNQTFAANSNPTAKESFQFDWTPSSPGTYSLTLKTYSSDNRCSNINAFETHSLTVTVTGTPDPDVNYAPIVGRVADQFVELGQNSSLNIDLWSITSDVETLSSALNYSIVESDSSVIDCTLNSNRYLTCAKALKVGKSIVTISASDGVNTGSSSFSMNVFLQGEEYKEPATEQFEIDWLTIDRFSFRSDYVSVYDPIRLNVRLSNHGKSIKDLKITALIPELGIRGSVGPFELDANDETIRDINLELDDSTQPGEYTVRLVASDSSNNVYRVKHRTVVVE